ncbi:MAG: 3-phosphoglycerate dehydrogenase family protein [Bacteroidetes bacterium]|nr:3-phosphoglycerate dehydrogenase family protein [Bacteroidota bacterium]MCY4224489.1 3-phosphoglycerate dehydrogenase family protein [Bacteroidota bacterium]
MFKIKTFNTVSDKGLARLTEQGYTVGEDVSNPDALLLRSYNLHQFSFDDSIIAVARCGAGVNNIPIDTCSERGIAVFNTPGANANSVKELVICALLLSSRRIVDGINWARTLTGDSVASVVEKGKKNFKGPEIKGKTLGIIGLGAIGVAVANAASALGMRTLGYDPFISVSNAWDLNREVHRATGLDEIVASADYITLHAPLNDKTKGLISEDHLGRMKSGVRILNFARGPLVHEDALLQALDSGHCACYVTDFVDAALAQHPKVLPVPHLGASTPEAEDNCAIMAAEQLRDYLEHGNVINSVNFPRVQLPLRSERSRIQIVNRNEPRILSQFAAILSETGHNIDNLVNKGRGSLANNVIDVSGSLPESVLDSLQAIDGVIRIRTITPS